MTLPAEAERRWPEAEELKKAIARCDHNTFLRADATLVDLEERRREAGKRDLGSRHHLV
jgi:hypothetical protein